MRKRQDLESRISTVKRLEQTISDSVELIEMGEMENDASVVEDAENQLQGAREIARLEIETLLSGEADSNDSFLEVHAGAGGTESQDWASMLMRMYTRWAEKQGYKVEIIECTTAKRRASSQPR
jgi:peptide chain release factor 2